MSASRWRRYVLDLALEFGAIVELTRGGHYRIRHPRDGWVVITSSTPGDERATLNTRAEVRRAVRSAEQANLVHATEYAL